MNVMHLYVYVLVPVWSPATGVTDGCEPPYGSWESNLGPQQEQQMLLTPSCLSSPQTVHLIQGCVYARPA